MRTVKDNSELGKLYKSKVKKSNSSKKKFEIKSILNEILDKKMDHRPSTSRDCTNETTEKVQEIAHEEVLIPQNKEIAHEEVLIPQNKEIAHEEVLIPHNEEIYPINLVRAEYNREQQVWNEVEMLKHHNHMLNQQIQNMNKEIKVLKDRTKTFTELGPCHINRPGVAIMICEWCDRYTNELSPLVLCKKISVVQVIQ